MTLNLSICSFRCLKTIGTVVDAVTMDAKRTPVAEASYRWLTLQDPWLQTVVAVVVIAVCGALVGSIAVLVCYHRYSNRHKGEWVVHGGLTPPEVRSTSISSFR